MKPLLHLTLLLLLHGYHVALGVYWVLRLLVADRWWWLALLHTFGLLLFIPLLVTIPLALLLRRGRTALLGAVWLVVGIVAFVPLPPLHTPAVTDGTPLRVMTYNLYVGNPDMLTATRWIVTQSPDVVVLQEVVARGYEPRLQPIYDAYPHEIIIEGSVRLYSRLPILEEEIFWIEEPNPRDGRLAIRAVLDAGGQPVTVYAVHLSLPIGLQRRLPLEASTLPRVIVAYFDEHFRNAQIALLLERIANERNPVLFLGDFNMSHSSVVYERIAASGLVDAAASRGFPSMTFPASPVPLLRIDYIWHTPDFVTLASQTDQSRGSDHLPLLVDLWLKP